MAQKKKSAKKRPVTRRSSRSVKKKPIRKKATRKKQGNKTVKKTPAKSATKTSPTLSHSGKIRVAINGFGRIGRMVFRAALKNPKIKIVAINDLTDTKTLAYLLKYDSVHGKFDGEVSSKRSALVVNGKEIPVYAQKDPSSLPWHSYRVDLVYECTGRFLSRTLASKHLQAGSRKVLLSAPHKCTPEESKIKTVVLGVNEKSIRKSDVILSNASCTTNCFAPLVKVVHDNFSIKSGYMVTVHAATATQHLVDGPDKKLRRARSALVNIIPTTTGAAKAIGEVIASMKGKLAASSVRVPLACGSICYFVAEVKKAVDESTVNKAFLKASHSLPEPVLEYVKEEIVSSDILDNPHSCIFDAGITEVEGKHLVTVAAWYDNEWGYSCRMIDIGLLMFK